MFIVCSAVTGERKLRGCLTCLSVAALARGRDTRTGRKLMSSPC